jgi:hypothetical protein
MGTDDARLREFFTAVNPSEKQRIKLEALGSEGKKKIKQIEKDVKGREKFTVMIRAWLQEHITFSLANHSKFSAVDMAWDSLPINSQILPLIQYAQGRMDMARLNSIKDTLGSAEKFCRKDGDGNIISVDLPKFTEININLIRSVITRRVAPQAIKYGNLWPHYKYEARDQTQVGKLRADMTSQRMDIMADQYGYSHHETQCIRDMFLFAHCVTFPRAYWEREVQLERATAAVEFDDDKKIKKRVRIAKEGLSWVNPHPTRVFYDNAYPLSSLNNDSGCEYVGFWDVMRWGDIWSNAAYFNKKSVSYTSGMVDWFSNYASYFSQYFKTVVSPPALQQPGAAGDGEVGEVNGNNPAANDRKNNVGLYMVGNMDNISTIFTNIYVKVRPVNWGWGTYPHPVWVHLKVAGDATVVYAKIMPSSPAAVFSFNESDGRLNNISMAHELMPFQDQLTNLFSQLLEIAKQDLFSVAILNTDVFPDNAEGKRVKAEFENLMKNKSTYASTQLLEVSFQKLNQLGIKPAEAFVVIRSAPNTAITAIFEAIAKTVEMANTIMVISQQEQGQAASHEQSAHESVAVTQTTNAVYDFIGEAIDEGRAAMKRICFESLIACGSDDVELSVENRYPNDILTKAGFEPKDPADGMAMTGYHRVTGNKQSLNHDYIFTTRDGGNRVGGAEGARTLVQLVQAIGSLQPEMQNAVLSAMGKTKVYELFNSIFRMTDAGVDLNLEMKPGEKDELTLSQDAQFMEAVKKLASQVQHEAQTGQTQAQAIMAIAQFIGQSNPQMALQIQQMIQQQPQPPGAPGQH